MTTPDLTQMRAFTRDAAAALVEDMHLIRDLLARVPPGPSRAEMRRLSASLRRLVVEEDLQKVATPRLGRVHLSVPDLKALVPYGFTLFLTVGPPGVVMAARPNGEGLPDKELRALTNERVIVNTHGFNTQPTICFNGHWIRRLDVIKFVANALSGVHSGKTQQTQEYELLSVVRAVLTRKIESDNSTTVTINHSLFSRASVQTSYTPDLLDPTLLDLLATAKYISDSPDVIELEKVIREELGL